MDRRRLIPVVIGILLFAVWRYQVNSRISSYTRFEGTTMGPIVYRVTYLDPQERNLQPQVDSLLIGFNQAMSTYIPDSEISRFNNDDTLDFVSPYFFQLLELSDEVHKITGGAFDPTVGPLVNAYGFGPGKKRTIEILDPDSLKQLVGFDRLRFDDERVIKPSGHQLDFSAIAKGYAVDVLSLYLEGLGIEDYLVEIGGEVRCLGQNPEGKAWRVAIEDPTVEPDEQRLFATVIMEGGAMATSGNYRSFNIKDGKKYGHTISPFTGEPVVHSLLSASVIADDCGKVDALATAFMVLGLEESMRIVDDLDEVEAFFIYVDADGEIKAEATAGISDLIRIK